MECIIKLCEREYYIYSLHFSNSSILTFLLAGVLFFLGVVILGTGEVVAVGVFFFFSFVLGVCTSVDMFNILLDYSAEVG